MEEGNHDDAPKRVTTPAGVAAIGTEVLSFFSEKPLHHSQELRPLAIPKLGL
jgi:hypothetical protein